MEELANEMNKMTGGNEAETGAGKILGLTGELAL